MYMHRPLLNSSLSIDNEKIFVSYHTYLDLYVQKACQAVAVLLHYFFLVSFMWMLMEGLVLYVALVRVFVKHQKQYMAGFTIFSYGEKLRSLQHFIHVASY